MGTANLIIIILPQYFHVISLYTISVKYAVFYSTLQLIFITCIALSDTYAIMLIFTYIRATSTVVNSFHRYQRGKNNKGNWFPKCNEYIHRSSTSSK